MKVIYNGKNIKINLLNQILQTDTINIVKRE